MKKNTASRSKRIAVIGAGIAGLSAAYELKKANFTVTVFEKEAHVGGRMATRFKSPFPFDIGANHLCDLYDEMKNYCKEFDLEFLPMEFVKYGVVKNKKVIPTENALGWLSRLRLAWRMLKTEKTSQTLDFLNLSTTIDHDTMSAAEFMKKACGKQVVDYIIDPFTSTYQFHRADEISAGALIALMESIKTQKPRWYLHHLKGEMIALPEALAKQVNVKVNTPITSIQASPQGVTLQFGNTTERFDAALLATPASVTRALYQNPTPAQSTLLQSARYAATIGFAFKVPAHRLPDTSVVWVPFVESQAISGYTNETMKGAPLMHDGTSLLCVWMHESFARPILKESDKKLFEIAQKELLKVCPWFKSAEELEPYDLQRWPEAMPKFYPGYLNLVHDFLRDGQGENNVFFAGDYLNSPWTEGALRCGKRVAETVETALRTTPA